MESTIEHPQGNIIINDNRVQVVNIQHQPERIVMPTTQDYEKLQKEIEFWQRQSKSTSDNLTKAIQLLGDWVKKALEYKSENEKLKKRIMELESPKKELKS